MDPYALLHDDALTVAGRTVGYAVFGDPAGRPVLWHHPTPSSRLEFLNPAEGPAFAAAGLRVICPDRPGYGRSDPLPGRTVADAGRDALAVLDELGVDAAVTVGFSGGGAPALAAAALAPGRITAVAVVAGIGPAGSLPPDEVPPYHAMLSEVRDEDDAYAVFAKEHGLADAREVDVEWFLARVLRRVSPGTRARLADPATRDDTRRRLTEPARQGLAGEVSDAVASQRDWGFRLGDVAAPVTLHYGTADRNCPPAIGRWLATRVPDAALRLVDADHGGLSDRLVTIMSETREP